MSAGPIKNSYWVEPGKFAAGEYPGAMDPAGCGRKLGMLLDAGIRVFVDLTEERELRPYEPDLILVAGERQIEVEYRRLPIPDVSVPSIDRMREIHAVVAKAIAAGRPVYVHCWGGIGRTGTVVGCYLVEQGMTGDQSLNHLANLWKTVEKHHRRPRSPETSEQEEFVRKWEKTEMNLSSDVTNRAQGCLMGQLAGDSLGSLVEFQSPKSIARQYPCGVRELAAGGTWNTLAGQPTDDSEMALMLARTLVKEGSYNAGTAFKAYQFWYYSGPFDIGGTTIAGLTGTPNHSSQANGALMRVSPLGIFGSRCDISKVADWARQDAALTHPHPVCQDANALYAMGIAHAIQTGCGTHELYDWMVARAEEMQVEPSLMKTIRNAGDASPADYVHQQGWVLIAFQNALWQLLHAPSFEEGVVDTVMRGGDTDTNAAICGALLGAVHGLKDIPGQWTAAILNCRPEAGKPGVHQPRPESFWPIDALETAEKLLGYPPKI